MDVVLQLWHGWNKRDFESGLRYLTDDFVLCSATADWRTFHGREGVREWRAELAANGVETVSTPFEWEQHGDHVLVHGLVTVTIKGQAAPETDLFWVFCFDGGLVSRIQTFISRADAEAFLVAGAV